MKRLIVIPIMFIYLLAVSGVMINMHYCGDELESWEVYAKSDGCADDSCSDEPEEESGCCKDEVISAKVAADQNVVDFFKLKLSATAWIAPQPLYHIADAATCCIAQSTTEYMPNAPPGLWQNIPLFKLHSSLTYYG
ncbi:hypothetical protein CAP35_07275 [Chitinophagaceae bacterium IBVUCB1]|nr:hypothetical protein CAP35_07275 [Chitinophagaceae bacterium IBVUCB1]